MEGGVGGVVERKVYEIKYLNIFPFYLQKASKECFRLAKLETAETGSEQNFPAIQFFLFVLFSLRVINSSMNFCRDEEEKAEKSPACLRF
jgi:hypothetical protein